jgi:hypothetical protein
LSTLLNTNENISTLALCYLDEKDEYLKEIDSSTYFAVSPLSVSYKRLYLVGDYIYKGVVTITATLPSSFETDYTVKIKLGEAYDNVEQFDGFNNVATSEYSSLLFKYGNAIPLDVMIYSNNVTETHTQVNFLLEWEE